MKLKDILKESFSDRPKVRGKPRRVKSTKTFDIIRSLRGLDMVEDIVDVHPTSNGTVALVRTKDGDAYEVLVKPSYMGDYFQDKRGVE